ncbi:MAG: cytochrome c [Bacteroidales bacterium]|nr:cytochrome c [Bacteroidales bacterium]
MKKISALSISLAVIVLSSCGGGADRQTDTSLEPDHEKVTQKAPSAIEAQLALGEKIYKEKCVVCHQADGKGVKGAFPPVAMSDYLQADPRRGVEQVLNGSHVEMVVNGETYNQPMTAQVDTKEEALAVINYVLKNFNGFDESKFLSLDDITDIQIKPRE